MNNTTITITDDMAAVIRRAILSFVATVNADGTPNLSPKASLTVRDGTLYFADMASPGTVENLRRFPAVEVNVVDVFSRRGYRFRGQGTVHAPGSAAYDAIARWVWETNGREYPVNAVVEVTVSESRPILSPAYLFGSEVTEDALREIYAAKYAGASSRE